MSDLDRKMRKLVESIDDGYKPLEAGIITKHPDGRTVKIIRGQYRDKMFGRISNVWYWREVLPDGSLGEEEGGYGWDQHQCYCKDGVKYNNETCERCGKHGVLDWEYWKNEMKDKNDAER